MSQFDFIKEIAKYGLENDQERLLAALNDLIEHSKKTKKVNFAIQLQSLLKEAIKNQSLGASKIGTQSYLQKIDDRDFNDLVLERLTSDYKLQNLVSTDQVKFQLNHFLEEHRSIDLLRRHRLPVSNKILLHGPSGCGKTLASYVVSGELSKMMIVVNLGAVVSSKLGETSKNLAKIFRKAATEDCIVFLDEFDSLGKVRDYGQDHSEMKRVVNTILQLFDYLPQDSIVIAATNQKNMVDEALLRRFDVSIEFAKPDTEKIKELVRLTLKNVDFTFDKPAQVEEIITEAIGLSYYSIQKTLINAVKRSLFNSKSDLAKTRHSLISVDAWKNLIFEEKVVLNH